MTTVPLRGKCVTRGVERRDSPLGSRHPNNPPNNVMTFYLNEGCWGALQVATSPSRAKGCAGRKRELVRSGGDSKPPRSVEFITTLRYRVGMFGSSPLIVPRRCSRSSSHPDWL